MTMPPRLRKLVLTAHITSTVGWLGAAAGFLALAVAGLTSQDPQMVRAVYLAAEPITSFVIVPLAFASLVIGVVQSLGTPWGLFRHYWVLFKLLITIFAIIILLQEARTVSVFAARAAEMDFVDPRGLESYVLHSGLGVLVLLVPTVLSVYKPRGRTPWTRW
ncbi:MAG: hypothetical protein WKF46_10285 [Candidatus Limnocylindrales bacterium]